MYTIIICIILTVVIILIATEDEHFIESLSIGIFTGAFIGCSVAMLIPSDTKHKVISHKLSTIEGKYLIINTAGNTGLIGNSVISYNSVYDGRIQTNYQAKIKFINIDKTTSIMEVHYDEPIPNNWSINKFKKNKYIIFYVPKDGIKIN